MKIDLILVPQGAEYRAIKAGLNKSKIEQPFIIPIPIGTNLIEENLTHYNFWKLQPQRVLMMGLCGSLDNKFSVGNTVLYRESYNQNKKEKISADPILNQLIIKQLSLSINNVSDCVVSGVTSDRIITTIEEKQQLAKDSTASVVDMESFAYLELLQSKNIAVSILRIVSDDVKYNLPNLEKTINDRGQIKPLVMTQAMLQQPIASARFIRGSLQALKKLQQVTSDLFRI